jgi:hypothetical protein
MAVNGATVILEPRYIIWTIKQKVVCLARKFEIAEAVPVAIALTNIDQPEVHSRSTGAVVGLALG